MDDEVIAAVVGAIAGALAGGLVSVWSGGVVARRAEARLKAARRVECFVEAVGDLRVAAAIYWEKAGPDREAEAEIKRLLEVIDCEIDNLRIGTGQAAVNARQMSDALFETITSGDFEAIARRREPLRAERIRNEAQGLTKSFDRT